MNRRPIPSNVSILALAAVCVGALLALQPLQAQILYSDDFNFTGDLDGRNPGGTLGATNAWVANENYSSDGSILTPGTDEASAGLDFSPLDNTIYELKVDLSNSDDAASWVSLGFGEAATTADQKTNAFPNANPVNGNGISSALLRQSGDVDWFAGPNVAGGITDTPISDYSGSSFVDGQFYEYRMLLDTTVDGSWTVDLFVEDVQVDLNGAAAGGTYTYGSNPTIGRVMLSSVGNPAGDKAWDNFSLAVIPEASSLVLMFLCGGGLLLFGRRRRKA